MLPDLGNTAARQETDDRYIVRLLVALLEERAITAAAGFLDDGMTNETAVEAVGLEERRLEREQGQQMIDLGAELRGPAAAPGPDLRRHVMDTLER